MQACSAEVREGVIRYLAGNHPGFEALLLPMSDAEPICNVLYR